MRGAERSERKKGECGGSSANRAPHSLLRQPASKEGSSSAQFPQHTHHMAAALATRLAAALAQRGPGTEEGGRGESLGRRTRPPAVPQIARARVRGRARAAPLLTGTHPGIIALSLREGGVQAPATGTQTRGGGDDARFFFGTGSVRVRASAVCCQGGRPRLCQNAPLEDQQSMKIWEANRPTDHPPPPHPPHTAATTRAASDLAPAPLLKAAVGVRGGPGGRTSVSWRGVVVVFFKTPRSLCHPSHSTHPNPHHRPPASPSPCSAPPASWAATWSML